MIDKAIDKQDIDMSGEKIAWIYDENIHFQINELT